MTTDPQPNTVANTEPNTAPQTEPKIQPQVLEQPSEAVDAKDSASAPAPASGKVSGGLSDDKVLNPYVRQSRGMIVTTDSSVIFNIPLRWIGPFSFALDDGQEVKKTDCLGVFSPQMILGAQRVGAVSEIPLPAKERKSYSIFQKNPQHNLIGTVCKVSLCNGWVFEGLVTHAAKFMLRLQCEHTRPDQDIMTSWANIYLHAITDLEILHPVGEHPDSAYWVEIYKLPPEERAKIAKPVPRAVPFIETPLVDTHQQRQKNIFNKRYRAPAPFPPKVKQQAPVQAAPEVVASDVSPSVETPEG